MFLVKYPLRKQQKSKKTLYVFRECICQGKGTEVGVQTKAIERKFDHGAWWVVCPMGFGHPEFIGQTANCKNTLTERSRWIANPAAGERPIPLRANAEAACL